MTMLEAIVTRTGQLLNVRIYDDAIVHCFQVHPDMVEYAVRKHRGELVCLACAELENLQEDGIHIKRLVLRTASHIFEILPGSNYTYRAFKKYR